jgi:ribosome biogenesis GTPase A
MPRCSKRGMSHSLKKLQRRGGVFNVRCSKSKRKQASRAENTRPNRKKKAPRGDPDGDAEMPTARTSVAVRAEARVQLGKDSRQAEFAKRRGLVTPAILSAAAGHGGPAGGGDDDEPDAAAAGRAAERALSAAPRNQRSFQKELARVLRESDVLLEVLDARDPMGCRCTPLEDAVLSRVTSKRVVLILNKIDLIPPDNARRWLAYLRQYFPTVPFKAQGGGGGRGGGMSAASAGGAEAFGGEQLLQLLKNYSRSAGIKTAITVGVVGYPNVGKSSLINALKRSRAVTVGATPGVTTVAQVRDGSGGRHASACFLHYPLGSSQARVRRLVLSSSPSRLLWPPLPSSPYTHSLPPSGTQVVSIDKRVKLVDCPGIVFARPRTPAEEASVLLRNCVKVEKMTDLHAPIEALMMRASAQQLREHFGIAR